MRTDEALWNRVKTLITSLGIAGTRAGQWSARKAQLAVRVYKEMGGDYIGAKSSKNSLVKWTRQNWRTRSGLPSSLTGERYLPEKAIEKLTPEEYMRTSAKKRIDTLEGKQFSRQPYDVAKLTRYFRI